MGPWEIVGLVLALFAGVALIFVGTAFSIMYSFRKG